MDRGYIEANGQQLYYEVHGKGEPLLLIMGLGGDATGWFAQIGPFAERFKLVIFDNRDAGRSSQGKGPYTIADMADDTKGLMDGLGIERAHILGCSMGGAIAQELALRHPEMALKLILACTMAQFARFHAFITDSVLFIREHDPDTRMFASTLLSLVMTHDFLKNGEAVAQAMQMMTNAPFPQSLDAFKRQTNAIRAFDALDRLRAVKATTLVLVGDQDIVTPPWAAHELARAIPTARLQEIKGVGHGLGMEKPEAFNQAVLEFLEG